MTAARRGTPRTPGHPRGLCPANTPIWGFWLQGCVKTNFSCFKCPRWWCFVTAALDMSASGMEKTDLQHEFTGSRRTSWDLQGMLWGPELGPQRSWWHGGAPGSGRQDAAPGRLIIHPSSHSPGLCGPEGRASLEVGVKAPGHLRLLPARWWPPQGR